MAHEYTPTKWDKPDFETCNHYKGDVWDKPLGHCCNCRFFRMDDYIKKPNDQSMFVHFCALTTSYSADCRPYKCVAYRYWYRDMVRKRRERLMEIGHWALVIFLFLLMICAAAGIIVGVSLLIINKIKGMS